MKKLITMSVLVFSSAAMAELYDGPNSPFNFNRMMGTQSILKFNQLPLVGRLADDRYGWSETYWPSNKGGIAYRWNHPDPRPFKYMLNTKEQLQKMSSEELGQLSPAELYDIAQGDYSYKLTRTAFSKYTIRDLWWEGICHGWSQAASNYPEPDKVTVTNPDGIRVPFGSSDVKALLAMHDAYNFKGTHAAFVGQRCRINGKVPGEGDDRDSYTGEPTPDERTTAECKDVNAGSFHVVLVNMIGIHSRSFVADVDRYNDVWNQPVTNYSSSVVGEEPVSPEAAAAGITRFVRVKTRMTYGEELKFYTPELAAQGADNFVSKDPVTATTHQEFKFKDYEYVLWINGAGDIKGGTWISETRPDFMWIWARHKQFQNSPIPLAGLNSIYRPVRR
jgi:Transglutaminase elicitor